VVMFCAVGCSDVAFAELRIVDQVAAAVLLDCCDRAFARTAPCFLDSTR
jgi:hypothetical protein